MKDKMLRSVNPSNGDLVAEYLPHSVKEAENVITATDGAQKHWSELSFAGRAAFMRRAARQLMSNKEKYSRLITLEMGKPFLQSGSEIEKCAGVCNYYARMAEGFLSDEWVDAGGSESFISYRPLGVVLAIMPWNFPFWQVFRCAAPVLMAGNAILLKHASNVTGCALAIEELFREAGFPEDLFRTLKLSSKEMGPVISNSSVKAVSLTGSVEAGRSVAGLAGKELKKTVLELGGSDPYVILEDANLEEAADICVTSRLINSGQSCIAAKRFIAVKQVMEEFLDRFLREMKKRKMGDPFDEETGIGPLAMVSLRDELHDQVTRSMEMGADCLLGGRVPGLPGAWYPPTVMINAGPGMPVYDEEIFGPVATIIEASDERDAVRIANDTKFGLGAAVFTGNYERGRNIARDRLNAGCCFVNDLVRSDPRLPFGGTGHSGYGRELSYTGIREFTNIKTVHVK